METSEFKKPPEEFVTQDSQSSTEASADLPTSPEAAFAVAEAEFVRLVGREAMAAHVEASRLVWRDTTEFAAGLAGNPEAQSALDGFLAEYAGLGDEELMTTKDRAARNEARRLTGKQV